jgi:hypothetical protein
MLHDDDTSEKADGLNRWQQWQAVQASGSSHFFEPLTTADKWLRQARFDLSDDLLEPLTASL